MTLSERAELAGYPSQMEYAVGDVFRLEQLPDRRYGFGQIVGRYPPPDGAALYVTIFATAHDDADVPLERIVGDERALLALTFDALLVHDRWQVVGNAGVDPGRIRWPKYKTSNLDGFAVEDWTGTDRRPATEEEVQGLAYRAIDAPKVVQDAFAAWHGQADWRAEYDTLRL